MFIFNDLILIISKNFFLTAYVTGNKSFPYPLSEEDENYYLEKFKNGDQLAKNILIERNLRLVAHIVKKYSFQGKDIEDLISIGTVGLIKAIDSYDQSKGTKLATYAARCIENEILMLIRNNRRAKREVFLQDKIGVDKEGNEITLIDMLSSDENTVVDLVDEKLEIKKLYEKLKYCLIDREKTVIELRYGLVDGYVRTQREISEILGISRSYVSRIEKKALKKLYSNFLNI